MKLNKLEIKYFNNIELRIKSNPRLISNGGFKYEHELIDPTLNDFYEFYIDGQPLIQFFLGPKKWIESHYNKYGKSISDNDAASLIYELGLETPLIYGCKICSDIDCGGISIVVKREPDFYCWLAYNKTTRKHDKDIFRFAILEYEYVFTEYLANWKKARTGEGHHPQISRFPEW